MLVKFKSEAGQSILMFGDTARTLLVSMGMSGDIPGAIAAKDLPQAIHKLKQALVTHVATDDEPSSAGDDSRKPNIPLSVRAYPLLQLLEAAVKRDRAVMWDADSASI